MSRFARSAPTQATAIDDTSVEILVPARRAHGDRLDEPPRRRRAARRRRARAEAAALARRRARGRARIPGLAAAAPSRRAHDGFDAATAALDPARAGDALRDAFAVAAEHGARGVRHLDAPATCETAIAVERPACALRRRA